MKLKLNNDIQNVAYDDDEEVYVNIDDKPNKKYQKELFIKKFRGMRK